MTGKISLYDSENNLVWSGNTLIWPKIRSYDWENTLVWPGEYLGAGKYLGMVRGLPWYDRENTLVWPGEYLGMGRKLPYYGWWITLV